METKEIWKQIKGYEGLYQVSNFGRVISLDYMRKKETRIMVPCKKPSGYLYVTLSKNGKRKNLYIHRIVAEAFMPNPENLPQVNHRDENKSNNFAGTPENNFTDGNLEWCDSKYNNNYGTKPERLKGKAINRKSISKEVIQLSGEGYFIKEFPSQQEAARQLGFNCNNSVSGCCLEKQTNVCGYIFIFKSDYSEEYVKKRVGMYKYTQSKEHRDKITEKLTNGKTSKSVVQLSMSGDFIAEYPSMKEVERKLGIKQGSVSNCCCGRCKSVSGFKFQFGEKYIKEKGYIPLF